MRGLSGRRSASIGGSSSQSAKLGSLGGGPLDFWAFQSAVGNALPPTGVHDWDDDAHVILMGDGRRFCMETARMRLRGERGSSLSGVIDGVVGACASTAERDLCVVRDPVRGLGELGGWSWRLQREVQW